MRPPVRHPNPSNRRLAVGFGDKLEGRYVILELLGVGGMGAVFLAEHTLLKRRVALKALHPEHATDVGMVNRFLNEAHAAGTLGHPNIVEATDMGFAGGVVPFIVFEYLEGSLLTEEIYRIGGLPPRRALTIARQIALALHAAHQADIVHLDLKCDNVFLTDKDGIADHVKVLDFGISKFMGADVDSTQPAVPMGTPEFMAPEQIAMPDGVDKRADIYGLGVCLYEMLAATRPFTSDDPRVLFHRILNEEASPIERTGVSPQLDAFVQQLMAKDRDARPQTMMDVVEAIDTLLVGLRPGDSQRVFPPPKRVSTPAVVRPMAPRNRSVATWCLGLLAVAATGGLVHTRMKEPVLTIAAAPVVEPPKLDARVTSAQLRVDALARTPMLRAAIETDGATILDMVRTEGLFELVPGETIEIYQRRGESLHSLVRLPATNPPVPPSTVVRNSELTVTAPIMNQRGEIAGAIAIATRVDD